MSTKSRFMPIRAVPNLTTTKSSPVTTNFAKGINTYKPNDTVSDNELHLAQNARFDCIGEYKTRRGLTKLCEAVGKAQLMSNFTNTYQMKDVPAEGIGCQINTTPNAEKVIYSLSIMVSATQEEYGVLQANIKPSKESNDILASSCINPKSVGTTAQEIELTFVQAPDLNRTSYYLEIKLQRGGSTKKYKVAMVDDKIMFKLNTATKGSVTSIFEANLSNSSGSKEDKSIIFTFAKAGDTSGNETMYRLKENGTLEHFTTIKTSGKPVRYSQDASTVRCVFGGVPYALTPTNLSEVGWQAKAIATKDLATDTDLAITASNIINGTQDNLFYFDAKTNTQALWTYPYGYNNKDNVINSYDQFDRDFRQNFPSINTGDPLTAVLNIGGTLFILTRRHKYQIIFDTVESWSQSSCAADGGTFSQESAVCGAEYAYYANDDGIFLFDGFTEVSLTKNTIQNVYDALENKERIKLEVHQNRLYVLCPNKDTMNPAICLVYNIKLNLWESFDTNIYVQFMFARRSPSRRFLCGHNRVGMLMTAESLENNYDDIGAAIQFELQTAYQHFDKPGQYKRITKWRPEFSATSEPYAVQCGYALDYNDVRYAYSIDLKRKQEIAENYVWDKPEVQEAEDGASKMTTLAKVHDKFRRCQIRYQHYAAFEPVTFRSHTLTVQVQRIR